MFQSIHFNAKPRAVTNASKPEVVEKLRQIVGAENILVEPEKVEPYGADAVKKNFRRSRRLSRNDARCATF
jgi:hypothetical protein